MKLKSQSKSPLVQLIFARASALGYKSQKSIADAAGVNEAIISRLAEGRAASMHNVYALLKCLGLLREDVEQREAEKEAPFTDLVTTLKELAQARSEQLKDKDRIRELESALSAIRLRYSADRRREDPPDFNPVDLRRPIDPITSPERHL